MRIRSHLGPILRMVSHIFLHVNLVLSRVGPVLKYSSHVTPRRSDGMRTSTPLGLRMNTLSLPNAPMNKPSSKITLSRGDGLVFPREIVMSSAVSTNAAKSASCAEFTRLSIEVREV